ncbi:nucleolar protein 8 [Melanotaenia boesemani]|uniref:nucleolar protein 8 n=1 Tax=Melanotaenia boesemani TaxID=1250792 RepID=UPI001C05D78A|nr:nucleolar protein 8 [Melanotaenia boesemani]
MRRLYVGGLSHTVTQKDLKDRFGKFGVVEDVELRTRRDEEGVPYKTFGYVNINISDADLKKCLTVLNKSKWKGGTLQIETAKESFLQRLAEERQAAAEHHLQTPAAEDKKQKLLDSFSKAGVDNFTMKAAVPGTEIPGHKDWVVSKFGRVLPVLQLRCRKGSKARTVKYDPSKYSHNIRRLDQTSADQSTPVSQLTWEVEGGDDDISKKRRGEFPHYEPPRPKRTRTELNSFHNRSEQTVSSGRHTEAHLLTNGSEPPNNYRLAQRKVARFPDNDVDSDEEIRWLVAAQQTSHGALQQQEDDEEDRLEVVGLDYLVQSGRKGEEDEDCYDSADTDELFASRKKPPLPQEETLLPTAEQLSGNQKDKKKNRNKGSKIREEEDEEERVQLTSKRLSSTKQKGKQRKETVVVPVMQPSSSESDSSDDDDEEEESADSCPDSDYEAMFSNVTHLEISLADLQKVAEEVHQTTETTASSIPSSGSLLELEPDLGSSPAEQPTPKKGTTPEEILAAILEEDSSEDEDQNKKKKKRKRVALTPLPAFQGTRSLSDMSETDEGQRRREEEEEEERKKDTQPVLTVKSTAEPLSSSSSCSSSEEDEEINISVKDSVEAAPSESSSSEDDEEEGCVARRVALGAKEEEELQRIANMRRLAALQMRQKEAEEHKRLIQGALANLDAAAPKAGKHIVFGSEDEDEGDEDKQQTLSEITTSKNSLFQDSQLEDESTDDEAAASQSGMKSRKVKPSGPQLFGGSEDEEDGHEEKDASRFDIRPQFEGQAGQKLMALQSRFGTDERFRMDSRFLEEEEGEEETEAKKSLTEEDEALEEERKKSLSILQSVLGNSHQPSSSKTDGKAKKFRDVSALHYDPSKEEHAAFETKTDETKKESKSARRKKREEAQKLPEVSKEIYYEVSGDLKAVFGQTKDAEGEETNWDKVEEEEGGGEEKEELLSSFLTADPSTKEEEPSGFKFSFFGDNAEEGGEETTEYKVENIQAPKVSWQQDPRFHDSSSEEEEEEQEKDEEQSSIKTTEEETPSKPDFFFFHPDDLRLKEGPRLFCRTSQLEEMREEWEERRTTLRLEYRKKHKDAQRKLTASLKS